MRRLSALLAMLMTLFCASALNATIYVWIDADGVKNYTNFAPPEGAEIFIKDSGVSRNTAENISPTATETQPRQPDAADEVRRLREELEAVKKLLAETLEAAEAAKEDARAQRAATTAATEDSSGEGYAAAEPRQSHTTIHKYYYPYYGYDAPGYFYKRHSHKKFRHKRHIYKKYPYGSYRKKHDSHRRGHEKRHWTTSKKNKQDSRHRVKHRIGSQRNSTWKLNHRGGTGRGLRMQHYNRR